MGLVDDLFSVCFELYGGGGRGLLGCVFDALPLFASKRALSLLISEAMLSTIHLAAIITNFLRYTILSLDQVV